MGKLTKIEQLKENYPDEPWRWKPEWNDGEIKGSSKAEAILLTVMALAFLGLSSPAVWAIPEEFRKGNYAILMALLFWVVGGGMLWVAAKRARQWLKYGTLVFRPEPLPGSWGGYMGGVVSIPKGARLLGDVKMRLRSQRMTVSGSGKNRRTRESILWECEKTVVHDKLGSVDRVFELPVLFHVPRSKGKPTDESDPKNRLIWVLSLEMEVAGLRRPLTGRFEIPVFDRAEDLPAPDEVLLDGEKTRSIEHYLNLAGVMESREADARVWRFHQPKAWKSGMGLLLFAAIFTTVGLVVPMILFKVVFVGVGLLLGAMLPGIWWHRSELRVTDDQVEVRRKTCRGEKRFVVKREDVGDLNLAESMKSGESCYFRLELVGVEGIEPDSPHPLAHFKARKARRRWRREVDKRGTASDATLAALKTTPKFEILVAGYLAGTQAADRVRDYLMDQLTQ